MRATGIVKSIDDLGRIVIPKEIRRQCGIKEGTPIELFLQTGVGNGTDIVLRKYTDNPVDYMDSLDEAIENHADEYDEKTVDRMRELSKQMRDLMERTDHS